MMASAFTRPRFVALVVVAALVGLPTGASARVAATSPSLGAAESYSVLAGSIVTNTGPTTIQGNVGVSPGIGSIPHVTGFPPGIVITPSTIHDADVGAGLAQFDATAAFGALSAAPNAICDVTYAPTQELAGLTLAPGVYCFPTSAQLTSAQLSTGTLILDGGGDAAAVWIFRMASGLNTTPGVNATVVVTNGGTACNVWWQVGSSATLGSGTKFVGNIMALTSISLGTGASLNGRALAQTGAVTLDNNNITSAICAPTAVELLYFRADPLSDRQMNLKWATAVELDNFGFNLYRASVNDRTQASLIHFEPAAAQGGAPGATYSYVDTAPDDGTWWYWLADVDTQGRETFHTPINAQAHSGSGLPFRIYLPVVLNGVN
ncbi:MAG: ice-binding family protein [Thermoflexales bacterium]